MKIGLYFGSFNPVHIGHLAIANYFVEFTAIDQVWFIISPHNPLKKKDTLLLDQYRYDLLLAAINNDERFHVSDIEFRMPKPSYTIDTLAYLAEKYPQYEFVLLMGSDALPTFHKWKNHEVITEKYSRYIYPRPGFESVNIHQHKNITLVDAPHIQISSSFIRESLKTGKDIRHFLPTGIYDFIVKKGFYTRKKAL